MSDNPPASIIVYKTRNNTITPYQWQKYWKLVVVSYSSPHFFINNSYRPVQGLLCFKSSLVQSILDSLSFQLSHILSVTIPRLIYKLWNSLPEPVASISTFLPTTWTHWREEYQHTCNTNLAPLFFYSILYQV